MKKTLFSLIITIISTINLQAAYRCSWVGSTSGRQEFNNVNNWEYSYYDANDNEVYATPSAISNAYEFHLTRGNFTVYLSSNCTVQYLVIGDNIKLDFAGFSLTTEGFQMQSPSTVDTSTSGSAP
jgi:hypothetical protein